MPKLRNFTEEEVLTIAHHAGVQALVPCLHAADLVRVRVTGAPRTLKYFWFNKYFKIMISVPSLSASPRRCCRGTSLWRPPCTWTCRSGALFIIPSLRGHTRALTWHLKWTDSPGFFVWFSIVFWICGGPHVSTATTNCRIQTKKLHNILTSVWQLVYKNVDT